MADTTAASRLYRTRYSGHGAVCFEQSNADRKRLDRECCHSHLVSSLGESWVRDPGAPCWRSPCVLLVWDISWTRNKQLHNQLISKTSKVSRIRTTFANAQSGGRAWTHVGMYARGWWRHGCGSHHVLQNACRVSRRQMGATLFIHPGLATLSPNFFAPSLSNSVH